MARLLYYVLIVPGRCLVLAYIFTLPSYGQPVRFSQYNAVPVQLNPASPGTVANATLGLNYRLQQLGIIAYKTGYFSAMKPLYAHRNEYESLPVGGLGVGILSDLAGEQNELKTYQIELGGAYNLRLNRAQTHYVTLGLQASYQRTNVDYGVLKWPSQITYRGFEGPPPSVGLYASSIDAFQFSAGVIWTYDPLRNAWKKLSRYRLHLGLAVANLNEPDYSFLGDDSQIAPRVYKAHGGAQFVVNSRLSVSPGFFIIAQDAMAQYAGGVVAGIHLSPPTPGEPADLRLLTGAWYRHQDALVFLIGASSRRFDTALSYDASVSPDRMGISRQHTLELSLSYRFVNERTPQIHPTPLF